jgi:hypothetical protein
VPSVLLTGNDRPFSNTSNVTGLNATTGVSIAWWQFGRPSVDGTQSSVSGLIISHSNTANDVRDGYVVGWNLNRLTFWSLGSAGSTNSNGFTYNSQSGKWQHYAVVFDDSANSVWFYQNGVLMTQVANTRDMTSIATTTTRLGSFTGSISNNDELRGALFDLQIFPNVVVPPQDIPLLMHPFDSYPGCKGRYFGVSCGTMAVGVNTIRDESGSGNNLNNSAATTLGVGSEPPFRFTIA